MTIRTYLDHNATSPLRPEAEQTIIKCLQLTGNASSIHAEGRSARAKIEKAREQVAALVHSNPQNVIFTSGGTEANMTVLSPNVVLANRQNAQREHVKCFISAIEHPCVLSGGQFTSEDIVSIPVNADGLINLNALRNLLEEYFPSPAKDLESQSPEPAPFLVSIMLANNETGAIQPISEIADLVHSHGGLLHTDAVQAAGKIQIDCKTLEADFITLSAHKIGGPQGVGALILCKDNLVLGKPLMRGGGQELKRRAGTENIAGIAGFGAASEAAKNDLGNINKIEDLRDQLETRLLQIAPDLVISSKNINRLPNTSCVALTGLTAELLLISLDLEGISVSSGSACSSGKVDRSHVLDAMQVPADLANAAIRISLGWNTTPSDVDAFITAWTKIYENFKQRTVAA